MSSDVSDVAEPCAAVKEPLRKTRHAIIDSCNFTANRSSERTPIAVHHTCGGPLLMDTSGMREMENPARRGRSVNQPSHWRQQPPDRRLLLSKAPHNQRR